ncbi:LysR family transcriptional regulator [Rhodopseudomonas sp. AAP120]|uniref:LysR family transcriptional regulator n=1 Tax=Rhodopseudomonas sp. AAP120 TaxID=1523430 RepID=UPI000A5C96E8|nr:LysR family transcriptional regulator [Rhodopseudomonas sp. AAP120]
MDLRHLRYIVASPRNGSFSAAAHEFNVKQPIVSKRIKEVFFRRPTMSYGAPRRFK